MKRHGSITTRDAMVKLGVMRLASRIHELRAAGVNIGDVYVTVPDRFGNEARVKKYFLVEEIKMGLMPMTREEALQYHRQMWGDMLEELGDDATAQQRDEYKEKWLDEHFPGYIFIHNCILCTYVDKDPFNTDYCCYCPINWEGLECPDEPDICDGGRCWHKYKGGGKEDAIYLDAPISEILALPEREV